MAAISMIKMNSNRRKVNTVPNNKMAHLSLGFSTLAGRQLELGVRCNHRDRQRFGRRRLDHTFIVLLGLERANHGKVSFD